jgi:hypothetical protein
VEGIEEEARRVERRGGRESIVERRQGEYFFSMLERRQLRV